jgi:hypothetical protein
MKKIIVFVIILANVARVAAQYEAEFARRFNANERTLCDARVELADSSINNQVNPVDGTCLPVSVIQYFYNEDRNVNLVIKKTLPERTNVYRQIFEYDPDQNITRYIYQVWLNNEWQDNLITERTYTSEGLTDTEIFLRENAGGEFAPYQRHFYSSEEGRISGYRRQVKDASGNWYDFSTHHYVYDELGRLTILYGKYINGDFVYWERTAVYGEGGHIAERFLKILKYDPSVKMNILTNTLMQKYHYNIYGNADTVFNFDWLSGNWKYTNKDINYYSLIKGKKVLLCHGGTSICISSKGVRAHLEHGDYLGQCKPKDEIVEGHIPKPGNEMHASFTLYPNPAGDCINVRTDSNAGRYFCAEILSSNGRVMLTLDVTGKENFLIDLSRLHKGTYYLKMQKEKGFDTRPFIKN